MRTLTLILALTLPALAHAGARKIPDYEIGDAKTTLKSAKKMGFKTKGKAKAYPKKVAIGYFATRYHFKETVAGKEVTTITTLKFTDPHYQMLTDELYAQLVARLEAEGMEVVDKEAVLGAAAYQSLEEKQETAENGRRVRFAASGLKNLPTFSGGPRNAKQLAALNAELGTDAVVAAFVNIGLCSVEPTKKTGMRSGTFACIKGDFTMPGVNLQFLGGAKGSGSKIKPEWTARWYKEFSPYEYNKRDKLVYDTALIGNASATAVVKNGFWKRNGITGLEENFVNSSQSLYDHALTMGFEAWDKTNSKGREKAGIERKAVKAPNAPENTEVVVDAGQSAAGTEAATGEVPALPGTTRCYKGSNTTGGKVVSEVLVRQGVDAGLMVEDSITLTEGQPPYRYVTTMTPDGDTGAFSAEEALKTWAGTGTQADNYSAWDAELIMGNGLTVLTHGEATDTALTVNSTMKDAKGKKLADVVLEATALDADACEEQFAQFAVPAGAF